MPHDLATLALFFALKPRQPLFLAFQLVKSSSEFLSIDKKEHPNGQKF